MFLAEYWEVVGLLNSSVLAPMCSRECLPSLPVFIYSSIVSTRVLFGNAYSAMAGGIALAVLMLPTVIKPPMRA